MVLVLDLILMNDRRLSVGSISSRSICDMPGTMVHVAMMFLMMGGRLLYLDI